MKKILYKTWIEVNTKALRNNIAQFRKILKPQVKIMAVVKSNAYGHGILDFPQAAEKSVDWFGVDSLSEGLRLRESRIKKPILVLGYTLPTRYNEAVKNDISITIYNKEEIKKLPQNLKIHLKIDTGMHRQGIYLEDLKSFLASFKKTKARLEGIYTHFASAKDVKLAKFQKAIEILQQYGYKNFLKHAAATSATLLHPEAHFDVVRLGIGLYGYYPSREIQNQTVFNIQPILTWKTIVAQVKKIKKGDFVGYDLTEKMPRDGKIAVLPIGYWHGYDRRFSSSPSGGGEVLIKNKRCRVLGRVSMDVIVVDISDVDAERSRSIKIGDEVILLSRDLPADELALKIGTISYELLTRINPLIPRIYV